MRWSYLIPRVIILSLGWAFFAWVFDPLLRTVAVDGGQQMTGSRVELEDLETSFFPPALHLRDIKVANRRTPGSNLIELDDLKLEFAGQPLLKRAFVVEHATISGLRWNTPRNDDGRVPKGSGIPFPDLEELAGNLGEDVLDELVRQLRLQLDPQQLETVRLGQDLEQQWQLRFRNLERRSRELKTRVNRIRDTVKDAQGNALARFEAINSAAAQVQQLLNEAQSIRNELPRITQDARGDLQSLDAARQRDLEMVRTKLDVLTLDGEALSRALLGQKLSDQLQQTLVFLEWYREQVGSVEDLENPQRLRGEWIPFPSREPTPAFLIRRLDISGEARFAEDVFKFRGAIHGLTTEPRIYGEPTVIKIKGRGRDDIEIEAVIDRSSDDPSDEFLVTWSIPNGQETVLGNPAGLAVAVHAERTQWQAAFRLQQSTVSGHLELRQRPVTLIPVSSRELDPPFLEALADCVAGVNTIDARLEFSGPTDKLKWTFSSELGTQIAANLNGYLGRQLVDRQEQLVQQAETLADQQMVRFRERLSQEYGDLIAELDVNEAQARQLIQNVRTVAGPGLELRRLLRQ